MMLYHSLWNILKSDEEWFTVKIATRPQLERRESIEQAATLNRNLSRK